MEYLLAIFLFFWIMISAAGVHVGLGGASVLFFIVIAIFLCGG